MLTLPWLQDIVVTTATVNIIASTCSDKAKVRQNMHRSKLLWDILNYF